MQPDTVIGVGEDAVEIAARAMYGSDFDGDWKPPYDLCCFEFVINGVRALALVMPATKGPSNYAISILMRIGKDWCVMGAMNSDGTFTMEKEVVRPLAEFMLKQIRAICIAMDAEVAVSEVQRAPEKLNRAREKQGKLPLRDYHVVSLARRHRVKPLEHSEPTGRRVRLHFRRGHWRHYDNHKTWIKWMLVGNPDLGFVDKHYKL